MNSRVVIGALLAVAALVAIVAPGGASGGDDASQPYPTRQVSIMAPAAPGVILGPLMETQARRALVASGDDFGVFFGRPLTVILLLLAVAAFVVPHLPALRRRLAFGEDD